MNKFGYATAEVGIEGGWGAVITTLQPASMTSTPDDWRFITLAMSLFRLEGATSAAWSLGEVVAGVSFNQCKPVGPLSAIRRLILVLASDGVPDYESSYGGRAPLAGIATRHA